MNNMKFSDDIVELLNTRFNGRDIYNMTLQELESFKIEIEDLRHEYALLEFAMKTLGNAGYGSCGNRFFYFYNVHLAGDITGECRELTQTMWKDLEEFFHETLWERKDLWKQFDFELDEEKHDWYRKQPVSIYSDTDSVYTTFGSLFEAMTPESKKKYDTDSKILEWILRFNKEFLDKQNNKWCDDMYNPRHGKNIHLFELETVSRSGIYLKKKKYLKGLVFSKGVYYEKPKVSGTGIEIIKSTTPKLCRTILKDLMNSLMFEYKVENKESYILLFNQKLSKYRKEFYNAPIEDISQSVGIGDYDKFVKNDKDALEFEMHCPVSVHGIARYNYLAHLHGEDNKCQYSGKIKYYNIRINEKNEGYFGYPAGELPEWAPKIDKHMQWQKTIINPINRFLEVMNIPKVNPGNAQQLSLF